MKVNKIEERMINKAIQKEKPYMVIERDDHLELHQKNRVDFVNAHGHIIGSSEVREFPSDIDPKNLSKEEMDKLWDKSKKVE